MSEHETALHAALVAHLRLDASVKGLLGTPARVFLTAPEKAVWPWLAISRSESRPYRADGGGVEHVITLTAHSRFEGLEEARAIAGAVRAALHEAQIEAEGVQVINPRVTFADVFRTADGRRSHAVIRVRAVTEEVASG